MSDFLTHLKDTNWIDLNAWVCACLCPCYVFSKVAYFVSSPTVNCVLSLLTVKHCSPCMHSSLQQTFKVKLKNSQLFLKISEKFLGIAIITTEHKICALDLIYDKACIFLRQQHIVGSNITKK